MKKYQIESAENFYEEFGNYVGDYIYAENPEEAVEEYKQWLIDNWDEWEGDPEDFIYKVYEYVENECGGEDPILICTF